MNNFVDSLVKEEEKLNKQIEEKFNYYKVTFEGRGFILNYRYYTPDSSYHFAYYNDTSLYALCARILEDFREDFDADFISIYDLSEESYSKAALITTVDHLNQIRDNCFDYMYRKA